MEGWSYKGRRHNGQNLEEIIESSLWEFLPPVRSGGAPCSGVDLGTNWSAFSGTLKVSISAVDISSLHLEN